MITDEAIESALNWLLSHAKEAGEAKANREYLDEYRKVLKAVIMRECQSESLGAQEARAYSDLRYIEHMKAWKYAIERDEQLRWTRTAAEAKISAYQTMCANNRGMKL